MPKKSGLSIEERSEVVLSLLRREESAAALARRYGVSEVTIYRWRDVFLAGGKAGLSKPDAAADSVDQRRIAQLERELAERAQIIGELSIANDILKKLQARSR